jgi:hypothetical protein
MDRATLRLQRENSIYRSNGDAVVESHVDRGRR